VKAPVAPMIAFVVALHWALPHPAEAQFGATATVEVPMAAGSELDPTTAATTLDLEERHRQEESLAEVLRESPGARALSLGALGSFSTLSLRGAGGEHTRVLFDTMPLGRAGEAFDLSTIPVSTLDRVEVYRGGAPVRLGAGAIGGVLRLVPRVSERERGEVAMSYGSFDTRAARISGSSGGLDGEASVTAAAGIDGTDGDFLYEEDLTPLTPGGGQEVRRQNGEVNRGYGLTHLRADVGGGTVAATGFGFGRVGGVPGPAAQPTRATRRSVARYGAMVSWNRPEDDAQDLALHAGVGGSYEQNRFTDRFGEIGLGRQITDDGTLLGNAQLAAELRLTEWASAAVFGGYRYERFTPSDALAQVAVGPSQRHAGAFAAEGIFRARLGRARLEVRPSARVEVTHAMLEEIRPGVAGMESQTTTAAPTLRLGAALEAVRGLTIVGSVASGVRVPTLTELFGDRGYLVGDTSLGPEHSVGGDLGLAGRGRWGTVTAEGELRGFGLRINDLIRYRRTSQYQAVPENVGAARVFGLEAGVRTDLGEHVRLSAALTLMATEDLDRGRELPLRPSASSYVRPELRLGPYGPLYRVSLYADLSHVADSFADPANLIVQPGRVRVGAGVGVGFVEDRIRIAVNADDLFDARGQDVLGFPLPGRSVFVDLTLATDAR